LILFEVIKDKLKLSPLVRWSLKWKFCLKNILKWVGLDFDRYRSQNGQCSVSNFKFLNQNFIKKNWQTNKNNLGPSRFLEKIAYCHHKCRQSRSLPSLSSFRSNAPLIITLHNFATPDILFQTEVTTAMAKKHSRRGSLATCAPSPSICGRRGAARDKMEQIFICAALLLSSHSQGH
jgi:hypothetical protein